MIEFIIATGLVGGLLLLLMLVLDALTLSRPQCSSRRMDRRCDLDQGHADKWHRSFEPTVEVWTDDGDRGFEVIQGGKRGAA